MTYRDAVKSGRDLTFVCKPCLARENITDDDEDGPPVLELSVSNRIYSKLLFLLTI